MKKLSSEVQEFVVGCVDCEREKFERKEFGLFGLDYSETKRMLNRLLKAHGLKLKIKTNHEEWGDQSEVQIVKATGR